MTASAAALASNLSALQGMVAQYYTDKDSEDDQP